MFQLHVWGHEDNLAIIDAECLAAVWYLSLVLPADAFEIVTSSNVNLSNSGQLPSLHITGDERYSGYLEIIRYLNSHGHDLDGSLDAEARAINNGLLFYIQENLQKITDYTLFLNKDNFEKYSRGIFGNYLPFPMQYNTPIHFRSLAKDKCSSIGLTVEDKTEVEEEMLKNVPTVSKVQKLKNESLIEEKLIMKNSLSNMKCLNLLKNYLEVIGKLKKELKSKGNIFHNDMLSSSDLLFLSHIFVQTNKVLPDQFITTFIEKFEPGLISLRDSNLAKVDEALEKVTIKCPTFSQSPNLFNAVRNLLV
jgi:sorting and assembly machinery component 37